MIDKGNKGGVGWLTMTKREFNKLHKICREEWLELARTGNVEKSERVERFISCCPACEISASTPNRYGDYSFCIYCPIKKWRRKSRAACLSKKESFYKWCNRESQQETKKYAQKIADLEWEWMPEYREVKIRSGLI